MPMMLGMLATSVISGRIISRFGRYKLFPILGTGTMTFGLGALSLLTIESNDWQTAIDALWLGLGMGMVMQVLIIAVQNSVDYKHLGVATSGTMLFRSLGGALGVALFGAIFANRLQAQLAGPGMDFLATVIPSAVKGLPPNLHEEYITAVMAALRPVFLVAAVISAVGFALAWMLREYPLREGAPVEVMGESFAMPRDATSLEELERIITLLVARENRWRLYADLARRAAVDLPAPELWMLARLGERAPITLASLSAELNIPQGQLAPPLDALCARGVTEKTTSGELELTSTGGASLRARRCSDPLPEPRGESDRVRAGGRRSRHCRAGDRRSAGENVGAAVRGGEPSGRRRQSRRGGGRAGRPRRLHLARSAAGTADDQRRALQEAQLRSCRLRAARDHDLDPEYARGAVRFSRQLGRRADRLCQGQSGQGQFRLARRRHHAAPHRRIVRASQRHSARARALPRHRAGHQ